VSQQSRPPAATTATSSAEPTAATEGVHHRHRHHHHHRHKDAGCRRRRHSSRRRCKDDDSSPSSRNRIRPLEPSADGDCSGGKRSALADKTADRKAAGAESEEEEGLDVMAAEQLEDCDSGCECGPEEAEGRRKLSY
jgi:hypothetical protein